jgi:PTH1 family peptidyl-tRNA hydrolase
MNIRVIAGLGNEGGEYEKTYHNVGSFATFCLKKEHAGDYPLVKFEDQIGGYMNVIGIPLFRLIKAGGILPSEVIVIHDDSDQSVGDFKIVFGGGSGGHKGVQSVIDNFQTDQFWRLKIGIRDPKEQVRQKAEEFVLKHWSKSEEEIFISVLGRAWQEMQAKKLV